MPLRTRSQVLLAKPENTPGTEELPNVSTDAIRVENPRIVTTPNLADTNEVSGVLDKSAPIVGGQTAEITFDVLLKGSGTAGAAPEFGNLLRACGIVETITASTVPASAEAAASGSTTTLTLSTGAATVLMVKRFEHKSLLLLRLGL